MGSELKIIAANASAEEAAAVVAALEQFMRDHAVTGGEAPAAALSGWGAAALGEGVNRAPDRPPFWT